ncbi:MAG TPA: nuclear transport factor 2 family protein [Thermoleophilaceae bacterium]|jgi:ketosteroid isomerase-like protein
MPENVEIARQVIEAFRAGLAQGDPGAVFDCGFVAANAEWVPAMDAAGFEAVYRGREGFVELMRMWTETFEWTIDLEEVLDLGDDRVVAFAHQRATGKASGASIGQRMAMRFELENGQVIRVRNFLNRDEALEVA